MEIRTTKYDEVEKELGHLKFDLLDKSATYQGAYFKDKLTFYQSKFTLTSNKRSF